MTSVADSIGIWPHGIAGATLAILFAIARVTTESSIRAARFFAVTHAIPRTIPERSIR
jgi:hypothetical protein